MLPNLEDLLTQAIELATKAHQGQVDKAGQPYINHSLRVMNMVTTLSEKIVAVLHDVIEDSDLTLEELVNLGFPQDIIAAIDAMTKRPKEDYDLYLNRVKSSAIATQVKIADLRDNMDISRIANPTDKDYQRLEKYKKALKLLLDDAMI